MGFAIPAGQPFGGAGKFDDKDWLAVDTSAGSPCFGNVYYSFTKFTGVAGNFPIVVSRSIDGGATFSEPRPVSQKGQDGSIVTEGSNIAVAPDGTVYVAYRAFRTAIDPLNRIQVARSRDCGRHFSEPVTAATFNALPTSPAGLAIRTATFPWIAVDDTSSNLVYVAYPAMAGSPANADIFVARSTDGGPTWGAPAKVNDDSSKKHQFFPTIAVSNGALHVAWYDLRDSPNPDDPAAMNDALNVYYASTNTTGVTYPTFSHNVKVSDVPHQPNCLMYGGGTLGFHGDYIELAARFDGTKHIVHLAWADNRDVPASECDLDPAPDPPDNNVGNRNQNIYADKLVVAP